MFTRNINKLYVIYNILLYNIIIFNQINALDIIKRNQSIKTLLKLNKLSYLI